MSERKWPNIRAAMKELVPDFIEERDGVIREALERRWPNVLKRKEQDG